MGDSKQACEEKYPILSWTSSGWWLTYPSEKCEFVSWDDYYSRYMESHKIPWFQTTNQSSNFIENSGRFGSVKIVNTVTPNPKHQLSVHLSKLAINHIFWPTWPPAHSHGKWRKMAHFIDDLADLAVENCCASWRRDVSWKQLHNCAVGQISAKKSHQNGVHVEKRQQYIYI